MFLHMISKQDIRTSARLQRKSLTDVERNDMSEAIAKRYIECFAIIDVTVFTSG